MNKTRIAGLKKELDSIYFADVLYWRQGAEPSQEARVEYRRRQDRLIEIRSEINDLQNVKALQGS